MGLVADGLVVDQCAFFDNVPFLCSDAFVVIPYGAE